jgi:hypothetical protein
MRKKSPFISSLVLAAMLMGVGCAKRLDDGKMSSDIQTKFSQDSGLSNKQLTVQANNGVVTLSGFVDNEAQRDAAGRQAASISGVKTVVNNLQIGDAPAMAETAKPTPDAAPQMAPAQASPSPDAKATPAVKADASADRKSVKTADKKHRRGESRTAKNSTPPPSNDQPTPSNDQTADNAPPPQAQDTAAETPPPPPPPPARKKLIIDQGTQMTVRLIDPIDSEKNQSGDTFHATLNAPLASDGQEAVPAGVELTGHLVSVKSAGKFAGQSEVILQLDSLSSGGKTYSLQTDQYKKNGSSRGKNTAEKVGGGAVIGSIIGALAGGGKGAAIGAAAGAGVGGGVQAATKSQQIKLASETVLNFTLQAPITVVQAQSADANRQKLGDSQ